MRVFLSYAREDEEFVDRVYDALNANNFRPWQDTKEIQPGQDWRREIDKALNGTDAMVIFVSPNSIKKSGVLQDEIKFALAEAEKVSDGDIFLIPVVIEKCTLPGAIAKFQTVVSAENENWETQLLAALNLARHRVRLADKLKAIPNLATKQNKIAIDREGLPGVYVEISYPRFEGTGDQIAILNAVIEGWVMGLVSDCNRLAVDQHLDENEPRYSNQNTFYGDFTIETLTEKLVSANIGFSIYAAGAAHPHHGTKTFNFLVAHGAMVSDGDVFFVTDAMRAKLKDKMQQEFQQTPEFSEFGELPDDHTLDWIVENFEAGFTSWTIKDNKIIFSLPANRLGAIGAGIFTATFDRDEMQPYCSDVKILSELLS